MVYPSQSTVTLLPLRGCAPVPSFKSCHGGSRERRVSKRCVSSTHTVERLTLYCSPEGVIVKSGYVTLACAVVTALRLRQGTTP